jgi:hypothetical protein
MGVWIQEGPRALRMKRPDLPVYYYHDHFVEMLAFVGATYGSILTDEHDAFVTRFQHLSKDAQCLLIRMVNRRGTIFNRSLFRYEEISDLERAADDLLACGQARFLRDEDYSSFAVPSKRRPDLGCEGGGPDGHPRLVAESKAGRLFLGTGSF